jgi:hypothetical protein
MVQQKHRLFAAVVGVVALLVAAGVAPAPTDASTTAPTTLAAPHQYVGYGYYGFPSPTWGARGPAVNYPGSGAAAWLGFSAPYSSSGFPYGGFAFPYLAYANPYAAYTQFAPGATRADAYPGSPGVPATDGGPGSESVSGQAAAAAPSGPRIIWDTTGYYVIP